MAESADNSPMRRPAIPAGVWALGFVSLLMDVSSEMIHAILPLYLVGALGASVLTVGIIEGIAEATASIVKIFSGALSDWLGRRKFLAALGYGLAAFTKPIFPLAGTIGWIVAARFIDRVGKGIRGAPRDALVADIAPPEVRGAAFGLRQSLDTVGAALGPLLAMLFMLLTADDFTTVLWIAVLPAFLSFGVIVGFVHEPAPAASKPTRIPLSPAAMRLLGRPFWLLVAAASLFTLARFSEAFLLLRAQSIGLSLALTPLVLLVMNVVYAASAWPTGILSDRLGRFGLLGAGLGVLVLADLFLALGSSLAAVMAGVALWGLHMGLTQGILASLIADYAPPQFRGTAFGAFNLVTGIALLVASVLAGILWDSVGPTATFIAGAGLAAASLLAFAALRRGLKGPRGG